MGRPPAMTTIAAAVRLRRRRSLPGDGLARSVGILGRCAGLWLTMDDQKNAPKTAEGQTVELWTELPEEVAGWVADAASRFHVSRSEIIQRAVEHFLGHVKDVSAAIEQRELEPDSTLDWGHAKKTLEHAHCPYDNCPFAGDCPVEVCPL